MPKKETRGGARKGTGPKLKYGEPTTTTAFRVPVSKVKEVRQVVDQMLKCWASCS
jgi:hypothetical protein